MKILKLVILLIIGIIIGSEIGNYFFQNNVLPINTERDSIEWQRFTVEFDDSTIMFRYMKRISEDSLYIWPRIDSLNNEQLRVLFELFKKHNYER